MKYVIALVILCSAMGGLAQIMLKKGMDVFAYAQIFTNWQLAIGVSLYGLSFILYNYALRFGDVTVLYPLIAFSYVFMMIFASFMLSEPVTIRKFIGAFVILFGVWIIGG